MHSSYPSWIYYPNNNSHPEWVTDLTGAVSLLADELDTESIVPLALTSDAVLAELAPTLNRLGYSVESGKKADQKIRKPVLYGENGKSRVSYEIDAFHDEIGVAVEVEAGRGAANNADYRDILRTSLLVDAQFLALFMPKKYRHGKTKITTVSAYANSKSQLDAIYASHRLKLPFAGVLLVGY